MNEKKEMTDVEGALTEAGYAALRAATQVVTSWRNHPGGRRARWERMIMRNSYTIDPRRPGPDEEDEEKDRLYRSARAAVDLCIQGGTLSQHEAAVRGWPTGVRVA